MVWQSMVRIKAGVATVVAMMGLAWSCSDHSPPLPPLLLPVAVGEQDCVELKLNSWAGTGGALEEPRNFCLKEDFRQRRYGGAGHTWPTSHHSVLDLYGGGIDLSLRGHALTVDSNSQAIEASAAFNHGWAVREGREFGMTTRDVHIHDGYIDLRSVGTGVRLANKWGYSLDAADKPLPDAKVIYDKTRYVLENLLIRTKGIAIQLEGDGNIIRNCIIESEGNAAIVIAGPNAIIENNRIILRDRLIPSEVNIGSDDLGVLKTILPSRARPRAAIVLRQASGARIIGNTIEVESASDKRHAVHVRDESKDVLMQGNRIVGPAVPAFAELGSVVIERDNSVHGDR
jgi:hypothetical protein